MKYSELQLATAMHELLEFAQETARLLPGGGTALLDELIDKHPCLDEINQFGPTGPIGSGLGRFGGHAVE